MQRLAAQAQPEGRGVRDAQDAPVAMEQVEPVEQLEAEQGMGASSARKYDA